MPNLRRSLTPQQGLSPAPARSDRFALRWPLLAAAIMAGLALAWINGGEEPLRPIAQPIELPEQPQ